MANEVLLKTKIEYSFESGSYSPTGTSALSSGSPTTIDLSLASIAAGGAAKQSDLVDLGATRPQRFHFLAGIEWFTAATKTTKNTWKINRRMFTPLKIEKAVPHGKC